MNEKIYDKESVIKYLLGLLPDDETEIFDELSFTDDDFAETLKAAEKDLVDAYTRGELAAERLSRFESYYLASPIRREKVEFAHAFQRYADAHASEIVTYSKLVETNDQADSKGFLSKLFTGTNPFFKWGLAFSALAIMILSGWLWSENSRQRFETEIGKVEEVPILETDPQPIEREKPIEDVNSNVPQKKPEEELEKIRLENERLERESKKERERKRLTEIERAENRSPEIKVPPTPMPSRPVSVAAFILMPPVRGNAEPQTLSIAPKTNSVALTIELETDEYETYRTALKDQANKTVWQSGNLKSREHGANTALNLSFPARLLKNSNYSIEVSGVNSKGEAEIIANYPFRAVIR